MRGALDRELIGDVQSTLHTTALDFVPHSLSMHSITQPNVKDQRSADCVDSETFRTPTLMSNWTIRILLFELAATVHQCLNGRAPPYLSEHCIPVSSADTRRHLRSANRHILAVYRVSGSTLTAVGRSQLLPGTHCRILSGIQRAAQTVLGVYLKRTCSRVTIVHPAHKWFLTITRYTNPRSHSLTGREGGGWWRTAGLVSAVLQPCSMRLSKLQKFNTDCRSGENAEFMSRVTV